MSWRDHAKHPNGPNALAYRHSQLTTSASSFKGSRINVVRSFARDKKVLDLGCVSHHYNFGRRKWLHSHVVEVAAECVGADYDEAGIKELKEAGYDVVHADVTGDISVLRERGPFDVVIAGEIIEHLPFPLALLSTARDVLKPGGELVITTPNPYAPHRQRMGANGRTWENVDHVFYCFPSGMAEMADRSGLVMTRFGSVGYPVPHQLRANSRHSIRALASAMYARVRGKREALSDERLALPLPIFWLSPLDLLLVAVRRRRRMLGETAIYVLTKPDEEQ